MILLITRESEEVPTENELLVEKVDDDFEAFTDEVEIDEELEELTAICESEIKVSDFDDAAASSHQADDPVKMYLRDIGQVDLLTITQESEFARTVQEGIASKEKIEAYAKLGKEISPEEMEKLQLKIQQWFVLGQKQFWLAHWLNLLRLFAHLDVYLKYC